MRHPGPVIRTIFFLLFLSCYLLGSLSLMMNFFAAYYNYILIAGSLFLVLYFSTYCYSYFSIKRRRKLNGYS